MCTSTIQILLTIVFYREIINHLFEPSSL